MLGLYVEERGRGSSEEEALQCVAAGYGEDVTDVLETLIGVAQRSAAEAPSEEARATYQDHARRWEERLAAGTEPATPPAAPKAAAELLRLGRPSTPAAEPAGPGLGPPLPPPAEAPPGLKPPGVLTAAVPKLPNAATLFSNRGVFGDTGLVRFPGQPDRRFAAGAGEGRADPLPGQYE